ncbi:MerR family transcriptional regulator [Nocardioides daeguensis]|uniref:HTH merR-type domain-containing protein n=1 Tax=Nocardioides daeguensis TaxID=908359 RepID=A0ABP6WAJ7_9ACTN|nr:MerR family transcriptional regulator [Nocardioides daeguensis]MBV6728078.1 MerR family transcriptional regulator [Nocardioides daeguensis]MCR1774152.1 MerR family transcriptional regulator [Nocardioides daeguensis]
MLTIGQLASYAGVTIRTVRHYHQVGLLPEPERDRSGYRTYDAGAVVRLIRIRTLADAGVPLARVQELLDADADTFGGAVEEIDRRLRAEIRELQQHRRRIAQLGSGDTLAVPQEVSDYLELVRATGVPEEMIEAERDAWILVAARYPDRIPAFMADKRAQLEDERTVRFYQLVGRMLRSDGTDDEPLVHEMADVLVELFEEAAATGQLEQQDLLMDDSAFVQLLDSMADGHPMVTRLRELLAERGWAGWTRVERA